MKLVRCDDSHRERWNTFVDSCPEASFYHRYEWRAINDASFGHASAYIAAMEGESIVGVFPIVRLKSRLFGNLACSMPFVNYGGPATSDAGVREALLLEGERLTQEWEVDYLEIRSKQHHGDRFPTAEHKVSMTLDLDPDPEVLFAKFKTGHRQDIRRAMKNDLSVKVGGIELLDDLYLVLSESWRDLGTPIYRKSYLERVITSFPDRTRITVIYAGVEPAAAAFDGVHNRIGEGMWLGIPGRFRQLYVGYALYWELIKNACEQGWTRFHLGRSTVDSGAMAFKKKWNASATQLYWQYVLRNRSEIPQLNVHNPKYKLAINAWRRLPIPVTQVVGPLVARSIP